MSLVFDCQRALDELQDWLRHESSAENAAALEAHLAICAPCRRHQEFEERFQALLARATSQEQCPPELRERLIAALRREARG
ncbi:MAG TPA: zf-HC2 domain-containing protein [Gemmatimonadales bacterium]|nr:zf-HC2 domain-containing protein [Gemmatimonadales bacterium]